MNSQLELLKALVDGHTLTNKTGTIRITDSGDILTNDTSLVDVLSQYKSFDIKLPEIHLSGRSFPAPEPYLEAPGYGTIYYTIDNTNGVESYEWDGDVVDFTALSEKAAFKTKADAKAATISRDEIFKLIMKERYK